MMVDELLDTVLNCYRSTLHAIGRCCAQAVPVIGNDLQQTLQGIGSSRMSDAASIERVSLEAETEIANWSNRAADYYRAQTEEVKQIMVAVARVAGCIGERDQRYAREISDLSSRLLNAAHLEDLAGIRQCLTQSAGSLTATAAAIMKSSQDSVDDLRAEVVRYETLLRESERRAFQDPLTGLINRRGIEQELHHRCETRPTFCVLIIDLNNFKEVNDTYGHVAGDDLLKQFARELLGQCEGLDVAGRLGGDEFIVITDRSLEDAGTFLKRLRTWIFGNYKINDGQRCQTASLNASAGLAAWDGKEAMPALLARADQAMYCDKAAASGAQRGLAPVKVRS